MIKYLIGFDATSPICTDKKIHIIAHCCNSLGKWGKGFVLALSKRYPNLRYEYLNWINASRLGQVLYVRINNNTVVANMVGQERIYPIKLSDGTIIPPIDYPALERCIENVFEEAFLNNADVHMPLIGCGLAGGKWEIVQSILEKYNQIYPINIYVYIY